MSAAPAPAASGSTALYLYGIVWAASAELPDMSSIVEGDVAAIVATVSLDEFGQDALRANLEDRAWLERTAGAHEDVLDHVLRSTTVVPFRIATLYETEAHVRDFLRGRHDALKELLERFEGRIELGVKAFFDRDAFRPAEQDRGDPASGRAYLLQRQAEQVVAQEADAFAAECARSSHEELAARALDARSNPPQSRELSGRTEQMILNGAYLVSREDQRLHEAVRELESRYGDSGVAYEVTGPWPPYNFVPRDLTGP